MSASEFEAFKEAQQAIWSAGDYHEVSRPIQPVADLLVERSGATHGQELLDVATGTGNVAVSAAAVGASVTALDLTPALLERARQRALQEDLEITFVEGDAESLPFPDQSFDRVTSCFGVMFAPRQKLAASELVRVSKPGGEVLLSAWTPQGLNGRMFRAIASYMPPPAPGIDPPVMWGDEGHVRSLFAGTGAELSFERHTVSFEHDSPEGWLEHNERLLGPTLMAKAVLEPQGRWEALRAELVNLYTDANQAGDGSFRIESEYLLSLARLPLERSEQAL